MLQIKELSHERLAEVIDAAVAAGKEELAITQTTVGHTSCHKSLIGWLTLSPDN